MCRCRTCLRDVLVFLLLLVCAAPLANAQPFEAAAKPFVVGQLYNPRFFDPARETSSVGVQLSRALYETLVVVSEDGVTPEPGVAAWWEVSDDGLVYTFHLREDARWSNGEPVTAEQFVEGWFRVLMPDTAAGHVQLLHLIKGTEAVRQDRQLFIDRWAELDQEAVFEETLANWRDLRERFAKTGAVALDPRTLRVYLAQPAPHFPLLVSNPLFSPLYGRVGDHDHDLMVHKYGMIGLSSHHFADPDHAVFNGPYCLADKPGEREIQLRVNKQYRNIKRVGVPLVTLRTYEDNHSLIDAYERGDVDWARSLDNDARTRLLQGDNPKDLHIVPQVGTYYYEMNCHDKVNGQPNPFADPKLRRALAYAFDRVALAKTVGYGSRPQGTLIPPKTMPGYDPPTDAVAQFDLDVARKKLTEAGFEDLSKLGPITLLISEGGGLAGHDQIAAPLVKALTALGLDVQVAMPDIPTFYDRAQEGNFHIRRAGWFGDFADPTTFLDMFRAGATNNWSGYQSDVYDVLLASVDREQDAVKRSLILRKAEEMLLTDAIIIPVYQYANLMLYDNERFRIPVHSGWPARLDQIQILPGK